MARLLTFGLEPSDVLSGLLRLRAAIDAGRWPHDVSPKLRGAIDREFARLEECVRALGLCYAELEERRVADINRAPQSRFTDVDGALHLPACSLEVAMDLDHLRMAVDRGDRPVRESAASLATALRHLLWYIVHSDLLVCPRMLLSGADVNPERVLTFIDVFLGGAWRPGLPPDPPMPAHEPKVGEHGSLPGLEAPGLLPLSESTAVFRPQGHGDLDTADEHALLVAVANESTQSEGLYDEGDGAGDDPHRRLGDDHGGSTRQFRSSDVLSDDALFFLDQSGTPWPCDVGRLTAARASLVVRTPSEDYEASGRAWVDRVERGFAELRRLAPR